MWPFRNLKLELDQAERANATLRNKLRDTNAEWRQLHLDYKRACDVREVQRSERFEKFMRDAAAERDAAIRHAGRLSAQLQGAMVRDSNGRLRKWVDPQSYAISRRELLEPLHPVGVARTNTYFDNRCGEMDG